MHNLNAYKIKGVVGDLGIEPSVRLREGVTVPCHTLRPVAHLRGDYLSYRHESTKILSYEQTYL